MTVLEEFNSGDLITKIKTLMAIKGYDTKVMAEKMDMSRQGFSLLINGHIKMKVDTLKQIAGILSVDAKILL